MNKRLLLIPLFIGAAAFMQAATIYKITLPDSVIADGQVLKAGEYKVEVTGNVATFRSGKNSTDVKVKSEAGDNKYSSTSVRYSQESGRNNLQEIHVGGTKVKLVMDSAKPANGGF